MSRDTLGKLLYQLFLLLLCTLLTAMVFIAHDILQLIVAMLLGQKVTWFSTIMLIMPNEDYSTSVLLFPWHVRLGMGGIGVLFLFLLGWCIKLRPTTLFHRAWETHTFLFYSVVDLDKAYRVCLSPQDFIKQHDGSYSQLGLYDHINRAVGYGYFVPHLIIQMTLASQLIPMPGTDAWFLLSPLLDYILPREEIIPASLTWKFVILILFVFAILRGYRIIRRIQKRHLQ